MKKSKYLTVPIITTMLIFYAFQSVSAYDFEKNFNVKIINKAPYPVTFHLTDMTQEYHDAAYKVDPERTPSGELDFSPEWQNFTVDANKTTYIPITTKSDAISGFLDRFDAIVGPIVESLPILTRPNSASLITELRISQIGCYPNAFNLKCDGVNGNIMYVYPLIKTEWKGGKWNDIGLDVFTTGNLHRGTSNLEFIRSENAFVYYPESSGTGMFPVVNNLEYRSQSTQNQKPVECLYYKSKKPNQDEQQIHNIRFSPYDGDQISAVDQIPSFTLKKVLRFLDFDMDYNMFGSNTTTLWFDVYLGNEGNEGNEGIEGIEGKEKVEISIKIRQVVLNSSSYKNMDEIGVPDDKGNYYAFEISKGETKYPGSTDYYIRDWDLCSNISNRDGKIIIGLQHWERNRVNWKFKETTINLGQEL